MTSVLKNIAMATFDNSVLRSKFRGCLLGSLLGDCLGAPYECQLITSGEKIIIQRYFDKLEAPKFIGPYRSYTDDTAMTKSVAKFLIEDGGKDYKNLAKLFVDEYFKEPNRGYGENVIEVFSKLKNSRYEDIYKPAKEQFWGSGSYGNGGAMRVAPVALYCYDNLCKLMEVAEKCTKITHTNMLGVNGALLQCVAVWQSLQLDPKSCFDPKKFCSDIITIMQEIEERNPRDDPESTAYEDKLHMVVELLQRGDIDSDDIIEMLGNGTNAYDSVPTAIYCFLRAQNPIPEIEADNIFRRTIQYAVTLGGDTDTIASMAGAIAGAYVGEEGIKKGLVEQCEFRNEMIQLADELFAAKQTPNK